MTSETADVEPPAPTKKKGLLGLLAAGGYALLKFLKLFKIFKMGGTLISMIMSIAVYSFVFGWRYAFGFVLLLFVHELGHYLAARQRNLPVSLPTFIPFVGAWIQLKEQPMDVETEAYVGSGGPFLGSLAALSTYFIGLGHDSKLLVALAYSGFFLNLFNMIPLHPLDGGRMTAILTPRIWFIGVPLMLGLMFYRPSPMLLLIAILALPSLIKAWRHDPSDPETARYYSAPAAVRIGYGAFYLSLAAFLAVMTGETHQMLQAWH